MTDVHDVFDEFKHQLPDIDPQETQEWVDSLDALVKQSGGDRARFVLYKLLKRARMLHVGLPPLTQTRYINTISPEQEPYFPGDEEMELHIRRLIRWNAVAMVVRANHHFEGIGGHLATYASAASLYEVGFNHFFRGKDDGASGDQIFFQGHAAPGIYARAFVEGRLSESQLDHFRGSGWNVIKVLWSREWDDLLARDVDGVLVNRMAETTDGESQRMTIADGAYIREHFFGTDPRLRKLVEHLSDEQLRSLRRGGHDYRKVYAAYHAAVRHTGAPTAILAQTVEGWALGPSVEARNITHQAKKMSLEELKIFRDRLELPIPDNALADDPPYYHPGMDSPEVRYMLERRRALGGSVPRRVVRAKPLALPEDSAFAEFAKGSGSAAASTTMAFTRLLRNLLRDKNIGKRVVPIIPDEARTFGMDPLFKEVGIYSPLGQRYEPVDAETLLPYREAKDGQVLEEGITEAGSMASFTAAGTSYATHGEPMLPFYVFYSMFGFQRTGDQVWAFGDSRGRGFMCGATAGRTTLNGEGLQHEDGHSHLLATALPNIRAYDPAFAYETAIIVKDGIRRMLGEGGEDIFYYLTLYNENYPQPPMPEGVEDGIVRGLYLFRKGEEGLRRRITLLGSGSIMRQVLRAQELLQERYEVAADVWSVTSYQLLRNEALEIERLNRLHPEAEPKLPYLTQILGGTSPIVAATDYLKSLPDQIARWSGSPFVPLGTDGFGRSDTREALRRHFEVDAESVTAASLHALALCEQYGPGDVAKAIADLGIDPAKQNPRTA